MADYRPNQNYNHGSYLQTSRSRANCGTSFVSSKFVESPRPLHFDTPRSAPTTTQETHPSPLISAATPSSATYLSTTSPQPTPSIHLPPPSNLSIGPSQRRPPYHTTPTVRVNLAQDAPTNPPSTTTTSSTSSSPANMSAVAVHYDSRFEMGMPRSSLTWPGLDSNVDLLGHDLSSIHSDASLTPPTSSRSVTASPPRGTLTPEARELKRQRDQARRDSKNSVRARRALSSTSYSSNSPPVTMAEFSGAPALPIYSTSPSQISLLAEPVTTVPGSNYIPSYSTSPLPETGASMFQPFPTLPSSGYMGLEYNPGFAPPPPSHALNGHHYNTGRPPSMSDPGMLYPVPQTVLSSGNGPSQETGGHVRVVQSRPKPQCWEHGCNGRQFSTFSNLLRHQREKSGQAAKATCPNCGAEFTRTTARNGHLLHDKCKSRRNS